MPAPAKAGDITPYIDGRLDSLLAEMDRVGIEKSVLCSIATKPGQFDAIPAWAQEIRSKRIIPSPSFQPRKKDSPGKHPDHQGRGAQGH